MTENCRRQPLTKLGADQDAALAELNEEKEKAVRALEDFEEMYGKKVSKYTEPPKTNKTLWDFVVDEVEKNSFPYLNAVRDFKRHQSKKLAKLAINSLQKVKKATEEKERARVRAKRELSKLMAKKVYKEFWQSAFKVHKFSIQQQSKIREKEDQRKRLDALIKQQLKLASQLAKVLGPAHSSALEVVENQPQEEDIVCVPKPIEDGKLGKRKAVLSKVKNEMKKLESKVIIELKKQKKNQYKVERVIYDEDKLKTAISKIGTRQKLNPCNILPPILLNGNLRYYQFIGLKWLLSLHQKKLNGILADEMGLGKTIQTIALLSYLAGELGIWGPHLIVVPTTLLVNWEMEFKRWAPGMKIFTYFGRLSERKEKRKGWSQLNSFQVCITSYKIVTLESKVFRRRKWYYLVLDEAQQIKNSSSQTWQCLSSFQTVRRLLLTGTPLQNNLIELWSLLAFLIPERFESHSDFKEWFSEPLQRALQSNQVINKEIIDNLHNILRPILLRRLKKDVEKELPKKTEVIMKVPLSMRQRYLYDEFITQDIKKTNNNDFLNLMNLLMQLRKICNHPDLVQPKDVESGLLMQNIAMTMPKLVQCDLKTIKTSFLPGLGSWELQEIRRLVQTEESLHKVLEKRAILYSKKFNEFNRELGLSYINQRHSMVKARNAHYRQSIIGSFVCAAHYLLKKIKIELKQRNVQKLCFKLGTPTFESFVQNQYGKIEEFLVYYEPVLVKPPTLFLSPYCSQYDGQLNFLNQNLNVLDPVTSVVRPFSIRRMFCFPKQKNVIFDSGKLNRLMHLLRDLKADKHKCLIFTQVKPFKKDGKNA